MGGGLSSLGADQAPILVLSRDGFQSHAEKFIFILGHPHVENTFFDCFLQSMYYFNKVVNSTVQGNWVNRPFESIFVLLFREGFDNSSSIMIVRVD